jgi:hypothetical protein
MIVAVGGGMGMIGVPSTAIDIGIARPAVARGRVFATVQKWSGPVLAALALIGIAAIVPLARESPFAGWFLLHSLAPERLLPLIGLGAACGLVGTRAFGAALLLLCLGIAVGFAAQDWLLFFLYNLSLGPTHLFLTGPIACLAIGLALVPGARLLAWLLPIAAFVVGTMLALAVFLTDPTLHGAVFIWVPLLAAIWIIAAVSLTLRAFRRAWFVIVGRILGSWLIAIGLMYGGTELETNFKPPPPPTDTSQESTRGAELQQPAIGNGPHPAQSAPSATGAQPPKQP